MTPSLLLSLTIRPVLAAMTETRAEDRALLLLSIAIQESGLRYRRQVRGPARSWFQIEPPTARDTLARYEPARNFVEQLGFGSGNSNMRPVLEWCDGIACAIAVGIVRLCPLALPEAGQQAQGWEYYLRAWRPGKPAPGRWEKSYSEAMEATRQ